MLSRLFRAGDDGTRGWLSRGERAALSHPRNDEGGGREVEEKKKTRRSRTILISRRRRSFSDAP